MAAKLGMNIDEALAAETETDVAIPEGNFFTPAQSSQRDNVKYNEGKEAGEEMAVKAVKDAKGLQFQGKKVAGLVEHLESLKSPDETAAIAQLKANIAKAEQERDTFKGELSKTKRATAIRSAIPTLNNGMSMEEAEYILAANGFEFKEENNTYVPYRNGVPMRDNQLSPLPYTDVIKSFFTEEKKWVGEVPQPPPAGKNGRGAGNSQHNGKGAFGSIKEIEEAYAAEHGAGALNTTAYSTHLQTAIKEAKEAGVELA